MDQAFFPVISSDTDRANIDPGWVVLDYARAHMADSTSRQGKGYLNEPILRWLEARYGLVDEALGRAYDAPEKTGLPAIQVGAAEGKLLSFLLGLVQAKRVVEIGTLAGYSAIWMARALAPGGHLWTLESEKRHAEVAQENIAAARLSDRVTVVVGEALSTLPSLVEYGPFCAVFLDADKGCYDRYARWATQNLRQGGLLIGDNALFFGKLLDDNDEAANSMRAFHAELASHYNGVCIPTPDGLAVGCKLGGG